MKKIVFSLLCLVLFSVQQGIAQQIKPFQKGDRVAFVGNSITDGGFYHSYIWLYYMTHFPFDEMWMANCGVGGDTSLQILKRLDDDVFSKNPTVLTLTFGMNDSGYYEYNGDNAETFANTKVAEARKNFSQIEKRLQKLEGVRVVMIGTSPYDQTSKFNKDVFKNKNNAIQRMIVFQDSTAKANKWGIVDFNAPMVQINAEQQMKDPNFTLCGSDRIHPDNDGHLVMAYLFLKAQGLAGKNVASVSVNAQSRKVVESDNCTITNLNNNHGVVSFNYLANSLPYPLDTCSQGWNNKKSAAQALKAIPQFMNEMNNEHLQVTGLKGNYRLIIDDVTIADLSAAQLSKGINLAEYRNTPQYQQAATIMALNNDRWEIERHFRDYAWLQYDFFMDKGLLNANNEKAAQVFREGEMKDGWVAARKNLYDKMIHKEVRDMYKAQMDLIVKKIYEINKPVDRKIILSPIN